MKSRILYPMAMLMILSCGAAVDRNENKTEKAETSSGTEISDNAIETAPPLPAHPSFNLTGKELKALCAELPAEIAEGISLRPEHFLQLIKYVLAGDPTLIRLVNKETGLNADDTPDDLVELDQYASVLTLSRPEHRISARALPALMAMSQAAHLAGIDLMISSAYRSYEYQEGLFTRYAERDGVEAAEKYSARPGKSQHQLGTALDFGSIDDSFASTAAGRWMAENAGYFGFSLSYPKGMEDFTGYIWESWHFRYTGLKACELEREFFAGTQEMMLRFLHEKGDLFRAALITE